MTFSEWMIQPCMNKGEVLLFVLTIIVGVAVLAAFIEAKK